MLVDGSTTFVSIFRRHWPRMLIVAAIVATVEIANDYVSFDRAAFSFAAVGLLVTALSIFLVFRVNEAYARWWEARTLWGAIVNSSRSFARQVGTLIVPESGSETARREVEALQRELLYRQIAWANALRFTLRREGDWEELESLHAVSNRPNRLLQTQGARLAEARAAGRLSDFGQLMFDTTLTSLHDAQGACERIKNTAFPDRVAFFTHTVAWALAIFIPIVIIDTENSFDAIDLVVVPAMMLAFVITERLGAELKNPFENLPNDTPMTSLCRTIEIDLRQQLGEKEVPPPLEPVNGVLM